MQRPDLRMVELLIEALTLQLNMDSHLYKTADDDALNEMYDALKHGMYQYRHWRDIYKAQPETDNPWKAIGLHGRPKA